eukprot:13092036-Alexandrium_andersonii.AAC.1
MPQHVLCYQRLSACPQTLALLISLRRFRPQRAGASQLLSCLLARLRHGAGEERQLGGPSPRSPR